MVVSNEPEQGNEIMATRQAIKGGEFGANGEFYEGGRFLNTIPENRKREGSAPKRAHKVEIEPYVWVVPTDDRKSIYRQLAGIHGKVIGGKMVISTSQQILDYTGRTLAWVNEMADRYNAGERWFGGGAA
jgi:hypothetical protein